MLPRADRDFPRRIGADGRAPRRARTDPCIRRDRARPNPRLGAGRFAAKFRNLVQLRDRLQSGAQPVDQSDAGKKAALSEADLEQIYDDLYRRAPDRRPHRLRRLARARRDQAGAGHDRRRRRHGDELFRKPCRRQPEARTAPRTATRFAPSSSAWSKAPRRWSTTTRSSRRGCRRRSQEIEQLQQNLEAVRTESLTDPLTTLSNRKFFDAALAKAHCRSAREERAVVADDGRHRPFQELQRQVRPSDRRSGAAPGRAIGEAKRQGPATSRRATAARNSSSRCRTRRCNRRSPSPTTSAARS